MRISDWSSDVCSSDLRHGRRPTPRRSRGAATIPSRAGKAAWREARATRPKPPREARPTGRGRRRGRRRENATPAPREDRAATATTEAAPFRSEERRGGKECGSTWTSRWAPQHKKKNNNNHKQ